MRDHVDRQSPTFAELADSRAMVSEMASCFAQRGIHATWATVGFLFASTRSELLAHAPQLRPSYLRHEFDPYDEPVGADERTDPEHLAGSLVRELAATTGQEVASHTFSHYYCLEAGQGGEQFRADLAAAQSAASLHGVQLTSLVLPRNQWNPSYADIVLEQGFDCIRGPQPSWGHRARSGDEQSRTARVARLIDTYAGAGPPPTVAWHEVLRPNGLCDIPASAFLRPYSPGRRSLDSRKLHRLVAGMRYAARRHRLFHLWWHPHNFTRYPKENFEFLQRIFDEFDQLADTEGMRSLSMRDVVSSLRDPDGSTRVD
jgi:hypothetical protein